MQVEWTGKALSDVTRLYDFLASMNRRAASQAVKALVAAPQRLVEHPRIGERLDQYLPREVRRIVIGDYELRYEIVEMRIIVLRLWHGREDR